MEPISPPNKMRQAASMLSGSFFLTIGALAYFLFEKTHQKITQVPWQEAQASPLFLPLVGVSGLVAIASFVVPRLVLPKPHSLIEELREKALHKEKSKQEAKRFTAHLLAMALSEAPGIFGFVLGMGTGSFEIAVPFLALSFVLMGVHVLRLSSWK